MKRTLLSVAVCALLFAAVQPMRGADVSMNFFYDNLSGGNWYQVADYGYVWQPDLATDPNWRPYTDGYWAYTDQGWTWVSYEDFGWATYHYGRWARLADYGWVWVPGYEWGPAWVSWRTGGNYVGWAPLPPTREEVVYEGRPVTGAVDVEFGIGPAYYNFIDLRYIGEPVLRSYIYPYTQNVTYIGNTVNVTNIVYAGGVPYVYGPDYGVVSMYSTRPIQYLTIQRESIDPFAAVRAGNITKVQGNKLVLAAPLKLEKANAQFAPKQIKAKIDQPKFEKGWSVVSDPKTKAQLEQKFKSENRKDIPKPTIQANTAVNAGAGTEVNGGQGKGKNKGQKFEAQQAAGAGASQFEQEKGKHKEKSFETQAAEGAPFNAGEQGKGKHKKENQTNVNAAVPSDSGQTFEEHKGKKNKAERLENVNGAPTDQSGTTGEEFGKGKHKQRFEQNANVNPNPNINALPPQQGEVHHKGEAKGEAQFQRSNVAPSGVEQGGGGKHRGEVIQGQQQELQGQPQGGQDGKGKGKNKKGEQSPTPPGQ